jgi:UDPglucose--hexose-1-phosphate uridylyltransferase
MDEISGLIEDLLLYATTKMSLCLEDKVYARNQLLELFEVEPSDREGEEKDFQTEILDPLVKYAIIEGITSEGSEIRFETKVMGLVTPSNGLVVKNFEELKNISGIEEATQYLYNISLSSNYIRLCDIKKNICWHTEGNNGKVGITINLSKPEKDAKQVLAERNFKGNKYPKCLLCLDNLGFCGTATHPARQTLRAVPINLNGESWHIQYSPYVYYDEHCIAFCDIHQPMKISSTTFLRLLDFVDIFPNYFLGSNADLPIVGGSILAHDHYQGGKKVLPMFSRPFRKIFIAEDDISLGIKDWYNSVVTIKGTNKKKVLALANKVFDKWVNYTDEDENIVAYTNEERHNTITPIASKENDIYVLDLILRNNRTDETHPYGIFHPTEDMHNIKKEGIGLIEAMGLFILPGRLKMEIMEMIKILEKGNVDFSQVNENPRINKHMGMIAQIIATNNNETMTMKEARNKILNNIEKTCLRILECTAVFKNTEEGQEAFKKFIGLIC